jgi:hypothetical protein
MNANTLYKTCLRGVAPAAAALILIGIAGNAAGADDTASKKLTRQIGVMEKIVDEVLLDSPNFLVYSKQNTHGIYLDEFGMLFSFEASILTKSSEDWWQQLQNGLGKKFNIRRENGKTIIEYEDGDEDKEIDVDDSDWEEKMEAEQKERYEAGKEELATVLLDYGDTLTGLRDAQTVAIAAFLRRGDFYFDDEVSTLVVKAKMSDLRAFAKGDLSKSAMQDRISYQEY